MFSCVSRQTRSQSRCEQFQQFLSLLSSLFSELERAIPAISQKMLIQQLRELERDGIVLRTIYPQIPPRVEYQLTKVGIALRPALRALLAWAALRKKAMVVCRPQAQNQM